MDRRWTEENAANACLISAAPDLLAACEATAAWMELLDFDIESPSNRELQKQIEAAVSKAKGNP